MASGLFRIFRVQVLRCYREVQRFRRSHLALGPWGFSRSTTGLQVFMSSVWVLELQGSRVLGFGAWSLGVLLVPCSFSWVFGLRVGS